MKYVDETYKQGPPNPPPDLKPHHCGWHGQLIRTCRKCERVFSKADGTWELNPCPDCGTHRFCKRIRRVGAKKCKLHGSGTRAHPGGKPKSKDGMFSRVLEGTGIKEDYERFRQNDDYLRLKEIIAIVDARLVELRKKGKEYDSSKAWDDLEKKYNELESQHILTSKTLPALTRAIKNKDPEGIKTNLEILYSNYKDSDISLKKLFSLIQEGKTDWAIWQDFLSTAEHRRKLSDSDRRLMVDMHQIMTLQQAMDLFGAVIADIRDVIGDSEQLALIGSKILARLSDKDKRAEAELRKLPFGGMVIEHPPTDKPHE